MDYFNKMKVGATEMLLIDVILKNKPEGSRMR